MKPRVGVYLSESTAVRLAEAAKHPCATKSALVEAALDRFLGSDDDIDYTATVAHHLAGLSRQRSRPRSLAISAKKLTTLPTLLSDANKIARALLAKDAERDFKKAKALGLCWRPTDDPSQNWKGRKEL